MAGRIPQSFIDDMLARIDIVDVVGQRIALKRAGKEYQARCPFHDERSPSFTVSPTKQFYHCFGCGARGTALGFLMQYDGLEFVDAVEQLAGQLGMTVPELSSARDRGTEDLYALLAETADYYQQQLGLSEATRGYLQRRGISPEITEQFGLGYAPAGWDNLLKRFGGNRQKLLAAAGLLSQGDRGQYDKFRDRLMFPIHDRRGRVIAYGGRVMGDEQPKYLNSPETQVFHKGETLYGLFQARQRKGGLQRLIVVEGYMDVLALAQHGFSESVATLGTATTRSHAELLFRQAGDVIFCFDGDRAGRDAAWRALESVLPRLTDGRQAHFLFLPDGEDPDSLLGKQGKEGFEAQLQAAVPLSEYFFQSLSKDARLDTVDGRARLVERCKPLIEQIPDSPFRDLMEAELARRSGAQRPANSAASAPPGVDRRPPRQTRMGQLGVLRTPVRALISLLLSNPKMAAGVAQPPPFVGLSLPGIDLLLRLIERLRSSPAPAGAVIESWEDPREAHAMRRLAEVELAGAEADWQVAFDGYIQILVERLDQERAANMPMQLDQLSADDRRRYLEQLSAKAEADRRGRFKLD